VRPSAPAPAPWPRPQIVKKAKAELLQRQVPAAAIASWQARIEALEPQVAAIVQEEREERLLRKAEMEAQKVGLQQAAGWRPLCHGERRRHLPGLPGPRGLPIGRITQLCCFADVCLLAEALSPLPLTRPSPPILTPPGLEHAGA
jgi:hypothetical protein